MKQVFLAAALCAGTAFAAQASSLQVNYQDATNPFGAENLRQIVKVGSETPSLNLYQGLVYAGEYRMTGSDGFGDFLAFCIDLVQSVGNGDQYEIKPDLLAPNVIENIDKLYSSVYDQVTSTLNAAAFQVALWEIVYDSDAVGGFDLDSGSFLTALTPSGAEYNQNVETAAETFLAGLKTASTGAYDLTFLYSGEGQDLVTATPSPVPLPAAGWMLAAGIGGLLAMRRARGAAQAT